MRPAQILSDAKKALVAVAGVLAQVLELGLLHGTALHWAQVASGAVAAVLVYVVPGPQPKPAPEAPPARAA